MEDLTPSSTSNLWVVAMVGTQCTNVARKNGFVANNPTEEVTGFLNKVQQPVAVIDTPLLAIDALYNERPQSAIVYAQQLLNKATNPGAVYAQDVTPYYPGLGFNLYQPIQAVWGWSVNFVYSIMIIIILVIAFALLFQNALQGNQVVTLQTAIPNIVIAMVLVPLSYPITAFAVDALALSANSIHGFLLSGNTAIGRNFWDENEVEIGGGVLFSIFGGSNDDEVIHEPQIVALYR